MVDEYWHGDVARISPEAPVPVVRVIRQESRKGAADNVVSNCEAMGVDVLEATCFASRKIRVVARSQQVTRIDFDDHVSEHAIKRMEESFYEGLEYAGVVIFSDYGKGALVNVKNLIARAKSERKTVLVDPKGHDYTRYSGADLVKPNLDEMRVVLGGWSDESQLEKKVRALMSETGIERVLLTRAAEGMTLFSIEGVYSVPAAVREVYDVTGAGDTAIAALAVALTRGFDWREAVGIANKAAGIVVQKFGTAVATEKEVFG